MEATTTKVYAMGRSYPHEGPVSISLYNRRLGHSTQASPQLVAYSVTGGGMCVPTHVESTLSSDVLVLQSDPMSSSDALVLQSDLTLSVQSNGL